MFQKEEKYDIEELIKFVHSIYKATGGEYPLLEWVDEKPSINDFQKFKEIYEPFLEKRLREEFDELYIWRNEKIIATFALVYDFENKEIEWIPHFLINNKVAFIEFLMVFPEHWGKGYGKEALQFALKRLRDMGKDAYVATSRNIKAYSFYKKFGFKDVCNFKQFTIMKYDWGTSDL